MKIFAIVDESTDGAPAAYLIYYEAARRFYTEITDDAGEWDVPFYFATLVKKGKRTVGPRNSRAWVRQRIVPQDRQNIGQILRDNNLKVYDEFRLLMLSDGRCAQDDFCLKQITEEELPPEIRKREKKRLSDVVPLDGESLLAFFRDETVKRCRVRDFFRQTPALRTYLERFPSRFAEVRIETDGHGIMWEENMVISSEELYESGKTIPLSPEDFRRFAMQRIVNTAEAAELLDCTRQNICVLVKEGKLIPIKETERDRLFLKGDVLKRIWK